MPPTSHSEPGKEQASRVSVYVCFDYKLFEAWSWASNNAISGKHKLPARNDIQEETKGQSCGNGLSLFFPLGVSRGRRKGVPFGL